MPLSVPSDVAIVTRAAAWLWLSIPCRGVLDCLLHMTVGACRVRDVLMTVRFARSCVLKVAHCFKLCTEVAIF
jgi:hypothetical protein